MGCVAEEGTDDRGGGGELVEVDAELGRFRGGGVGVGVGGGVVGGEVCGGGGGLVEDHCGGGRCDGEEIRPVILCQLSGRKGWRLMASGIALGLGCMIVT